MEFSQDLNYELINSLWKESQDSTKPSTYYLLVTPIDLCLTDVAPEA